MKRSLSALKDFGSEKQQVCLIIMIREEAGSRI